MSLARTICRSLAAALLAALAAGAVSAQTITILDTGEVARPRINESGEVVWAKRIESANYTIFSNLRGEIAVGGNYRDPDINDDGEIIWRFGDGGSGPNGVESNERGILFSSSGQDPYYDTQRIMNGGEVICGRDAGAQTWSTVRGNLTTYGWFDRQDEVNDLGEVVVRGYMGPTGNTYDIYSTERGAITNDAVWQQNPDINDSGEVVWDQDGEVWSNLRGFVAMGTQPSIADSGEIVWTEAGELYSSERGRLTNDALDDRQPQVNSAGLVTFLRDDNVALLEPDVAAPLLVYESTVAEGLLDPANVIGTAEVSPFEHAAPSAPVLFYFIDDGAGVPPEIRVEKGGPGILISF